MDGVKGEKHGRGGKSRCRVEVSLRSWAVKRRKLQCNASEFKMACFNGMDLTFMGCGKGRGAANSLSPLEDRWCHYRPDYRSWPFGAENLFNCGAESTKRIQFLDQLLTLLIY
jgi:hypothetical protein